MPSRVPAAKPTSLNHPARLPRLVLVGLGLGVRSIQRNTVAKIDGDYTIDTGHVVAYEDSLNYDITKAGGSWLQSFLAGEGFVMNFHGRGRVLVQSHNPAEFGQSIGSQLPPRG